MNPEPFKKRSLPWGWIVALGLGMAMIIIGGTMRPGTKTKVVTKTRTVTVVRKVSAPVTFESVMGWFIKQPMAGQLRLDLGDLGPQYCLGTNQFQGQKGKIVLIACQPAPATPAPAATK